ncbi:sister chromatid cohesion protein PDS5 homolog D isoform X3 [Hevea brasiliensis]|uniref:sister chromatid cohesion protein PDS5 homolog D isoform X3 n=1 Tax=Hevea brasiliensis TaxID=3981 RepID=UPI0025CCF7E9|nr:sister chromatid cohesion protein PDS5 homolog D isoform X3 [Hevea brasiliensis]
MAINEIELQEQLKETGNRLLDPPSSIDELLNMLDKLECLLINVEQAPSRSMQDALLSPMKALISNALLRNSDTDVKVSAVSCISEITRITAPDAPYSDDHMKEIFQLTIAAFEKLSHVSSRCYTKAVSILDTVARVRSCLVMLDLELDELIIKMFQHFLKIIRSNHPPAVFFAMETIMTLIIDESEDISVELLTPLLASIRKENQSVSPIAWKLGAKVIANCAAKLKPYVKEAVQAIGIALDEFAPIVASICQDESLTLEQNHVNGSGDYLVTKGLSPVAASPGEVFQAVDAIPKSTTKGNCSTRNAGNVIQCSESTDAQGDAEAEVNLEMEPGTIARKRGWKPNSLMNPEEGYDHSWISAGRKTAKLPCERISRNKGVDLNPENPVSKKVTLPLARVRELTGLRPETGSVTGASSPSISQSLTGGSDPKRGWRKKNVSTMNQGADSNSEVKQHKHSRKLVLAANITEGASLPSADEKAGFLSEHEEKPLQQSTKIEVRNFKRGSSPVQKNIRKRSSLSGISDVNIAEASGVKSTIKKTKSSRDGSYEEEISKTNLKRKRTPRKEVPSDLGEQLTGRRIKVWWPKDKTFYEGVLDSYDPIKKKHKVLYADGDEEILNLRRERWELIGGAILPDEQEPKTDIPNADPSSDKPQKQNGEVILESAKQRKIDLKGATSISKRKARKSAGAVTQDEPIVADKAMDDTSRPNSGAEGDGKGSTGKLKIGVRGLESTASRKL